MIQWYRHKKALMTCWWWKRSATKEMQSHVLNYVLTPLDGKGAVDILKRLSADNTQVEAVMDSVIEALQTTPFPVLSFHTARLEALLESSDLVGEEAFALTVLVSCGKYILCRGATGVGS